MTGFIRGLFSPKPKKDADQNAETKKDSGEFFLDADTAKTYGDIDYMRTAKAVRKSYPKTLSNNDLEGVEVISSMEKLSSDQSAFMSETKSEVAKPEPSSKTESKQQSSKASTDTNLDMFRKMAKDIKK